MIMSSVLAVSGSSFVANAAPRLNQNGAMPHQDQNGKTACVQVASGTASIDSKRGSMPDNGLICQALTINDYIEYGYLNIGGSFTSLSAEWSVPSAPTNQNGGGNGNLIAIFDAIQDNNPTIIQPVLGWGCLAWDIFGFCHEGGGFWWMSAVECCPGPGGSQYYTSPIQVSVGDIMWGSVTPYPYSSGCSQSAYTVLIEDETTYQSTSAVYCTNNATPTAFPIALEGRNINTCNDLPPNGIVNSRSISSNPAQSFWYTNITPNLDPQCSYGTNPISNTDIKICWNGGSCSAGGGGCVDQNTPILTDEGYRAVQSLRAGDTVAGYDLNTGRTVTEHVLSNIESQVNTIVSLNNRELRLTATDQPIYVRNSTYTGWERNPENLRLGDSIFNPITHQWVAVTGIQIVNDKTLVYDLVLDGPKDFIANGFLLLDK